MKKFLIIFVAINVLLGGLAIAGVGGMLFLAETTPFGYTSPFYGVQTWAEMSRLRLSRDEGRRAEFALKLVDRRLADLAHAPDEEAVIEATNAVLDILDEAVRAIDAAPLADQDALYAHLDRLLIQANTVVSGLVSTYDNETVLALSNRLAEFQKAETREELVALVPPAPKIAAEVIPFLSKAVDHSLYPLEGAHTDVACESCHTDGEYKGTPKECTDCHRPPANGVYAAHFEGECVDCHTLESWDPYRFDHLAVVECESCHMKDRPAAHYDPPDPSIRFLASVRVKQVTIPPTPTPLGEDIHTDTCMRCHTDTADWNTFNFDHFGFSDCASCHLEDDAPDQHYAGQCSNCHNNVAWEQAWFNHTGFTNCATCHTASTTPHYTGYACATCHTATKWTAVTFQHTGTEDCTTCHSGEKPAAHYDGQCSTCHNTVAWDQVNFSHSGLTDCQQCHQTPSIHYQAGCTNCHNTESWQQVSFSHSGLNDCASCHGKSDHYSGQCSNCHNTNSWGSVNFNHTGLTTCVTCHEDDMQAAHYPGSCDTCHNTQTWSDASYDHSSKRPCTDCHSNVTPPDHYTADCALCHGVDNWAHIVLDHDNDAVIAMTCTTCHERDLPLPLPHYDGECSECHTTVSWAFVHQGLESDCQSCHTYEGHWPGQCSDCHLSVSDWTDYKFDHTGYTDCKSCHPRPDGHPRGQCSKCHNTDSWTDTEELAPDGAAMPTVAPERPGPTPTTPPATAPVAAPVAAPSR